MERYSLPADLPELLVPWYKENRRELPWRETDDAYHIWVSEIMLQQTRVEAVKKYYSRFLEVLPDVQALADCDDDTLYKLWEGLGYYSRVRCMKKAAQTIVSAFGGVFPRGYEELLTLPGIGEYTAGAIGSIAFGLPTPAVDGNVLRVCSRLADDRSPIDTADTKRKVRDALIPLYPPNAGEFTQALMELGATLCGPNWEPDCAGCPCKAICLGFQKGTAAELPIRSPKKERRQEDKTVLIMRCGDCYALRRRGATGLLAGLWEFPNVSGKLSPEQAVKAAEQMHVSISGLLRQSERKHVFTHITWNMRGYYMEAKECSGDFYWYTGAEINAQAALPTAFRKFWEEIKNV